MEGKSVYNRTPSFFVGLFLERDGKMRNPLHELDSFPHEID